jgi:hypothetical protein
VGQSLYNVSYDEVLGTPREGSVKIAIAIDSFFSNNGLREI